MTGTGSSQSGPGEGDAGLARERTSLSWTRTAISFAALGGVVLRANVITGLIILAVAPLVWQLGRLSRGGSAGTLPTVGPTRIRLITVSVVGVSLLALLIALLGPSVPGALHCRPVPVSIPGLPMRPHRTSSTTVTSDNAFACTRPPGERIFLSAVTIFSHLPIGSDHLIVRFIPFTPTQVIERCFRPRK